MIKTVTKFKFGERMRKIVHFLIKIGAKIKARQRMRKMIDFMVEGCVV